MKEEPEIIINGVRLSTAEAMTVRVAMGIFMLDLQAHDFGEIGSLYQAAIRDITRYMRKS